MTILAHPSTQSLIIKADDPFALRDLLPDSRSLNHADYNLAVKHTLETTKVLRNVGLSAPAPIRYTYKWPGKFVPYVHQVDSAEFLTLHKRAFVLSDMGCVDATTEFLSPTGWRRIDSYTGGPVAQYHPDTGRAEFVEPTEYVKLPCTEMLRVKTKYGIDQLLSPEHRVLVQAKHSPDKHEVVQAIDLTVRQERWLSGDFEARQPGRISWSQTAIPATFSTVGGTGLPLTHAQLRVQVAVIADGHFPSTSARCVVKVKKQRKKDRLRELLLAAQIEWVERSNDTATSTGYTAFTFVAPRHVKVFDEPFWSATPSQIAIIADEVGHWDGSFRRAEGIAFSSYSKESADFVQYAFVTTGRVARLTVSQRERRGAIETEYTVHARASDSPLMLQSRGSAGEKYRTITPEASPDGYKYCFMVPSTFLVLRRNGCVFCTGNTGKTSSTLWAADWLMANGYVRKTLIISPLSTLDRVWKNEIFDTLMHRVASVVHGTQAQRKAALDVDADFYILNHDGVTIKPIASEIQRRADIDLVVLDEASMFRNHDTKKYKALVKMLREDQRLWLLTGTPCPNAPTDAWALAKLINPAKVPPYLGTFRRQTMMQITQFKWVPRPEAYAIAYSAMQPAVRFRKADCIDLPPVVTEERSCDLTTEQKKMFDAMRNEMQIEAKGGQINAVNAADKINKLRQILCGAVKDPVTDSYIHIPHEKRLSVLLECIEQASAKVLVVVPFKGIIYDLAKEVGKHYSVGVLNGDVSLNQRNEIIAQFKHSPDPHVLLCHPKVMSHGLNLTEADTLVFYAPIYSNDEAQQVVERFNRPGQKNKMTVIRLGAHKLEWDIYKMVEGKRITQASILGLYQSITE